MAAADKQDGMMQSKYFNVLNQKLITSRYFTFNTTAAKNVLP